MTDPERFGGMTVEELRRHFGERRSGQKQWDRWTLVIAAALPDLLRAVEDKQLRIDALEQMLKDAQEEISGLKWKVGLRC